MILEGWRDAIWAEQYSGIQYDCASAAAVAKIRRLAKKERLTPPKFIAAAQRTAVEIRSITPDPEVDEPAPVPDASAPKAVVATDKQSNERRFQVVPPPAPPPRVKEAPPPPPEPEESPEAAAERERRYREIFGIPEPKPRRRWRH